MKFKTLTIVVIAALLVLGYQPVHATSFDDNFTDTALDSKWTVVDGSSGTVNLLSTNPGNVYDLTSEPGWLSMQSENDNVFLRQDHELNDGDSIVMKASPGLNAASNVYGEVELGFTLNTGDSSPTNTAGSGYMNIMFAATNDAWRILARYQSPSGAVSDTAFGDPTTEDNYNGGDIWFRIARIGSSYAYFVSFNGITWTPMKGRITPPTTFTNVWIRSYSSVDSGKKTVPVQHVDYIKEVAN